MVKVVPGVSDLSSGAEAVRPSKYCDGAVGKKSRMEFQNRALNGDRQERAWSLPLDPDSDRDAATRMSATLRNSPY